MTNESPDDHYTEEETAQRAEQVIRHMLATPPQPRTSKKKTGATMGRPKKPKDKPESTRKPKAKA